MREGSEFCAPEIKKCSQQHGTEVSKYSKEQKKQLQERQQKMKEAKDIKNEQIAICSKYDVVFCESPDFLKVGISKNIKEGARPINGLRHPLEGNTTGWYIWGGEEYSEDPDFFVPLHVEHLKEWCPLILKYLGLPPGWRFLVTDNYEDVWEDKDLLNI